MEQDLEKAAKIIRNGGVVAFPTETVYGLGADATNDIACRNIFKIKGRPSHNPLIVHISSIAQAMELAEFNSDAKKLTKLWPGPLSLVLPIKKTANITNYVTAGLETIALRIPADPIALKLINLSGRPIAAPSANKSGKLSATRAEHVMQHFGSSVFTLKPGINKIYGLESTILDLSASLPTILRFGYYTKDIIGDILQKDIVIASPLSTVKAPGMLLKHYSPETGLRLNASDIQEGEIALNFADSNLKSAGSMNLSSTGDLVEAASNLYDFLYRLDNFCIKHNVRRIAIAPVPLEGIGIAINDRLMRAAE